MSGKGHAVLWMGILLIAVRMFTTDQWHAIWGGLSNGSTISLSGGGGNPASGLLNNIFNANPGLKPGLKLGQKVGDYIWNGTQYVFRPQPSGVKSNTGLANPGVTGR